MSVLIEILLRKIIDIILNWLVKKFTTQKILRAVSKIYRTTYSRLSYRGIDLKGSGWQVGGSGG